ncbi:ADP,ATP carrier protein 1 [Clostridia bacterium]|nr:ADP,ATP carrier protein 1 [Clostridia bacterium]
MESQGLGKQSMLSKIRGTLWPVYGRENKKFIPMSLLMICILFMYTLFRDMKDSLVQKLAVGGGTAMLSTLKIWFVLPISLIVMAVFMKLSNKFSSAKMFYGIITIYLVFYALFGFVLFPNAESLHGSAEFVASLRERWPHFLYWIIPCITNWSITIFYLSAELWAGLVIGFLFWQFANEITKSTEAPRFYSMFGFLGNLGLIASGSLVELLSKKSKTMFDPTDLHAIFGWSLKWQMGITVGVGLIMIAVYAWMQKEVVPDPELVLPGGGIKKKEKPKMGVRESIVYVATNPYVLLITCLVLGYGMAIVLNESLVKTQFGIYKKTGTDYNEFMGGLSFKTGCLTMVLMLVGTNILKRSKWRTSALITPIVLGGSFLAVFGLLLYQQKVDNNALIWGIPVLNAVCSVGEYQLASNKGVKYSLFDSTKNMAYLPMDSETKLKSQAAVEVVGSRIGKAGGSAIVWFATSVLPFGTSPAAPGNTWIIGITCFVVLALWVVSVLKINPKVVEKLKEKAAEEKETQAELNAQKASVGASK